MSTFKKVLVGALALVAIAASSADAATYTWTKTLKLGSKNAHVMDLQKFLNMCPNTAVATSGAGSPGHETKKFGPSTKAAVMKFQTANGIAATGVFGPLSRAKAISLQASGNPCTGTMPSTTPSVSTLPAGCTSTAGFSPLTGVSCASVTASTPSTSGPVSVSLAANNPGAGSIASGQALADLAHFTFSGSGTVTGVTLQRTGFSTNTTLQNVYLYNGAQRLTDAASVNANGVIVFNNLSLTVSGSTTISVMSDIDPAATSGQTVGVTLTGFTANNGSMTTVSFPGNIMTIANSTGVLATATLNTQTVATGATVNAGTAQYSFFSAPLQVNLHALWLKGVRFMYIGSAANNSLANVNLYVDGVSVAKSANGVVTDTSGTYVMFDLSANPFSLSTGSHTLEVRADVNGGSARTAELTIQNKADLVVSDVQNSINVGVTGIPVSSPAIININAGSATITVDPNFSALSTVTGGASNATIGKFVVTGYGENVKVMSLVVTPTLTNPTPAGTTLNNVALYFNGSQVGSSQNYTGTALTFNLGSSMIIPANSASSLEVHADIQNGSNANYTAGTLAVAVSGTANNAQGLSSLQTIAAGFPASAITTNGLSIQTGVLAVSKNPAYVNQTVSPNTPATKIGSYVLQNQSSSESIRITNLAVAVTPTTFGLTNLANLRTSETSGSGSVAINPQANNNFSVNFTLAPGATKTIDILADVSTATGSVSTTLLPTTIGVSSNVVLTPTSASAGQTITIGIATFATPTIVSSTTTPSQYIAVGTSSGVSNATKASYNFTSTNGASTISALQFTVTTTSGANDVTAITVNGTTAPVVGNLAYLTGLNISVPNSASGVNVDAYASYGPAGASGVASGSINNIALTSVKYTSGGATTVITPNVSANAITIVGSVPAVSVNGIQQTGLILGSENKVGEVTVSANAAGNIKVNTLVFNLGNTGFGSGPTFSTPRIADGSTTITGSSCVISGSTATCTFGGGSPNGYLISAGTSKTFSLFITVNGTAVSGSKASVSAQVSQSALSWDDLAGAGANLNGSLIYNFPTQSYSVSQ